MRMNRMVSLVSGISVCLSAAAATPVAPPAAVTYQPRSVDEIIASQPDSLCNPGDSLVPGLTVRPLVFRDYGIHWDYDWKSGIRLHPVPALTELTGCAQGSAGRSVWELPGASREALTQDIMLAYMVAHPDKIEYLAWTLPDPPSLKIVKDDTSEFLISDTPVRIEDTPAPTPFDDVRRTNWLHKFDAGLQFSQAYLSPNWYQGGTNNLTLLVNFLWNVTLNEVYHPNLLLESNLSYKLGLYSTPQDEYHKYSISEDLFQYNFKFGIKARKYWFYSLTMQYKTQFLNNYGENSTVRKAAFMSPGEFNAGLGMTYSRSFRKDKLKLNLSIAPVSYNLKTSIDHAVDPTQFSIPAGAKTLSQIGSNAELTLNWQMTSNISWKTRAFIFTDYDDFQGDWENTLNFAINRFLSTQIYLHLRYDTNADATRPHWRHWMIKEILSFGFRYAFSTK